MCVGSVWGVRRGEDKRIGKKWKEVEKKKKKEKERVTDVFFCHRIADYFQSKKDMTLSAFTLQVCF